MANFIKILSFEDIYNNVKLNDATKRAVTNIDVPIIIGASNRSIHEVWMSKTDRKKIRPEQYDWKRMVSSTILNGVGKEMGTNIVEGGLFQSLNDPDLQAIIHGLVEGENSGITCVTCTTKDGWENEEMPFEYAVQAQWCMNVSGCDKWYVACLVNCTRLFLKEVDRDDSAIEKLTKDAKEFLDYNVKRDKLPMPLVEHEMCAEAVKEKYLRSDPSLKLLRIDEGEYDILCEDIVKLRSEIYKQKQRLDLMLGKLKLKMEFNEHAGTATYKITWKSLGRRIFDTERFKEDYPEVYEKYLYIDFRRPVVIKPYSTTLSAVRSREYKRRKDEALRDQKLSK